MRLAVVEVEPGVTTIAMISPRAKGVRRIVQTWEKRNVGKTAKCASSRAYAEAEALVKTLAALDT